MALESTDGSLITVDDLAPDTDGRPTNLDAFANIMRDDKGKPIISSGTWPNTGIGRLNLDGTRGSCAACHSRHDFSPRRARQPENCGKCHLGPDHPQKEIYEESKHGIAFRDLKDRLNLDADEWVARFGPADDLAHMDLVLAERARHLLVRLEEERQLADQRWASVRRVAEEDVTQLGEQIADTPVAADLPAHEHLRALKIARGTQNFARGPAMTRQDAEQSILYGFQEASRLYQDGVEILGTGDMGIGNTTPSAAIGAVICGAEPGAMVGRGTGVDIEGLTRKREVVARGIAVNNPDPADGLDVLHELRLCG